MESAGRNNQNQRGQSVLEVILAAALFAVIAIPLSGILVQSMQAGGSSSDETVATQYATEGLEAVRDIRNQSYTLLATSTGEGVALASGTWSFVGTSSTFQKFTRVITVTSTYRDGSGNIVASGGTLDPNTRQVISTVTWGSIHSVSLSTYLTDWRIAFNSGNPVPTLATMTPINVSAGLTQFTLNATGTNFIASSVIEWNSSSVPTTYLSSSSLAATITTVEDSSAGTSSITVFNPTPGGGTSTALSFTTTAWAMLAESFTTTGSASSGYKMNVTITNTGTANTTNTILTSAQLGSVSGTPLPQNLGTITAGGGVVTTTVAVSGSAGADGSNVKGTLGGSFSGGGTFSASIKSVTLP